MCLISVHQWQLLGTVFCRGSVCTIIQGTSRHHLDDELKGLELGGLITSRTAELVYISLKHQSGQKTTR